MFLRCSWRTKYFSTLLVMCAFAPVIVANFSITPTNAIQAEGLDAFFFCQHDTAESYSWRVDNISITTIGSPNVSSLSIPPEDGGALVSRLTFKALPQYNGSIVECVAFTERGRLPAQPATLTIQGRLSAIANLEVSGPSSLYSGNIISLSWDAPFSLDITDTDPDITYCVGIVSTTTNLSHVFSQCRINDTRFNVSLDHVRGRTCDIFNITITPVNGAGNGSTSGTTFESNIIDPKSIQLEGSSNNTIELSNDICPGSTNFSILVVLVTFTLSDINSISADNVMHLVVNGVGTKPNILIDGVAPGQYIALLYNIGGDGLPQASPIAREIVCILGTPLNSPRPPLIILDISYYLLDIQYYNDTLNITCNYERWSTHQGCSLILQYIGTLEEFETLTVNPLQRSEASQLQVQLDREESLHQSQIISVEFVFPTTTTTTTIATTSTTTTITNVTTMVRTIKSPDSSDIPTLTSSNSNQSTLNFVALGAFVVGVLVGAVLTALIVIIVFICIRRKQHCTTLSTQDTKDVVHTSDIQMTSCEAYEVGKQRSEHRRESPVYEDITI